jgi:pimeloyl-ACP methyl ester carboxylesterase
MFWCTAVAMGGWCYQPVARLLRAEGHEVYAPSLTGLAEREHLFRCGVDLDCHIDDIVRVLHFEDLRRAILVGHSYGGMVITGAADRAADRVGHLVYLDAAHQHDPFSSVSEIWTTCGRSRTDEYGASTPATT